MSQQTILLEDLQKSHRSAYLLPLNGLPPREVQGVMTIGRSLENDFPLNDMHASSTHCQIERRPKGFFIRDLKSRNGVLLNKTKVLEAQLDDGDEIKIGESLFLFQMQKPTCNSLEDVLPITSKNKPWALRLKSIKFAAQTLHPIFLQGESGTGKEVVAHLIHNQSPRSKAPFISVNCSALTETLVESELFGHVKGSFTGATHDRKGAFESARGGTLFLDEIGDLPASLQPKLLRALENKEIRPVGSDKTISTDVRIITATHKNIDSLVAQNIFRSDLYFRINVVKIPIPALKERMEDFETLLYSFAKEMRVRFSVAAIEEMKKHPWPGNIRELRNTVARANAIYPQVYIQPDHISDLIDVQIFKPQQFLPNHAPGQRSSSLAFLKNMEKDMIISRLIANKGNQRKTAHELGIPKSTLHDRIRAYNIEVKSLLMNLNGFKENTLDTPVVQNSVDGDFKS